MAAISEDAMRVERIKHTSRITALQARVVRKHRPSISLKLPQASKASLRLHPLPAH
jgi:hypothetical protein